jgi:hypothetical protein
VAPAAWAALVVVAGLGVRAVVPGGAGKYAGDVLYATLVYCLVVAAAPSARPGRAAGAALAWCFAVEFAQLTPLPGELSGRYLLARLVLGSTFNVPDLGCYVVGVLVGLGGRAVGRRAVGRPAADRSRRHRPGGGGKGMERDGTHGR